MTALYVICPRAVSDAAKSQTLIIDIDWDNARQRQTRVAEVQ